VHRPAPKAVVHDVEAVIFRTMSGHRFMTTPAGLRAVVTLVTALERHTRIPMQANTTAIAAFTVRPSPSRLQH